MLDENRLRAGVMEKVRARTMPRASANLQLIRHSIPVGAWVPNFGPPPRQPFRQMVLLRTHNVRADGLWRSEGDHGSDRGPVAVWLQVEDPGHTRSSTADNSW